MFQNKNCTDWFKKVLKPSVPSFKMEARLGFNNFLSIKNRVSVELEKITDMNFNNELPKIKSFIQQWNRRILTPIGRITVVKTLILLKLNHLFISLSTPKNEIIAPLCIKIFLSLYGKQNVTRSRELLSPRTITVGLENG